MTAVLAIGAAMLGPLPPRASAASTPRVAIIVGPVGGTTPYYRSLANEAASAARKAGAQVVTVYSPNATWPAVKQAVDGASIVVYLGHGNGWPSRYRDALYPPTQDGFGLNPVAGGDDSTHQYFGEKYVAGLHLASNAVVIFSHLCYASGNSEPGLPEGTRDQAIQRVDNYAAGFLRAGASAVIAEAYLGPAYYVKALLRGRGSVESIWNASPTANRHTFAVASARTSGYSVHLDPERAGGGYVRSLVSRGVTAAQLRAGASGSAGASGPAANVVTGQDLQPSLISTGIQFAEPVFAALPIAGTTTSLTLPLAAGRSSRIPAGAEVSVRWDPILLDAATDPAAATPGATPAPSAAPPAPSAVPSAPPSAGPGTLAAPAMTPTPGMTPTPLPQPTATPLPEAPPVDLVVPEQTGSVVVPVRAARTAGGLRVSVAYPGRPGLYRLAVMLHTPQGVAYDAATQALLVPVIVRVGRPIAVAYGVPATLELAAGSDADVPVRVLNAGSVRWDLEVPAVPTKVAGEAGATDRTTVLPAHLVGTWISADGLPVPGPVTEDLDPAVAEPGGTTAPVLHLAAPANPGSYLLMLDVVSPANGALSALGSAPAIIRVTVTTPVPTPAPEVKGPPNSD